MCDSGHEPREMSEGSYLTDYDRSEKAALAARSEQRRSEEALHFRQMMTDPPWVWRNRAGAAVDLRLIESRYLNNIIAFCDRFRPEYKTLAQYGFAVAEAILRNERKEHTQHVAMLKVALGSAREMVMTKEDWARKKTEWRVEFERAAGRLAAESKRGVLDALAVELRQEQLAHKFVLNALRNGERSTEHAESAYRCEGALGILDGILARIDRLRKQV